MSDTLSKLRPRGRVTTIDHGIIGKNESKEARADRGVFRGPKEARADSSTVLDYSCIVLVDYFIVSLVIRSEPLS